MVCPRVKTKPIYRRSCHSTASGLYVTRLAREATTTIAHKIMIVELLCDLGTRYGLYRSP